MILSKATILELMKNDLPLVENLLDPDIQIQNNGVDLTVEEVLKPKGSGIIDFDNSVRQISEYDKIYPMEMIFNEKLINYYPLARGSYIIRLREKVNIPKNIIGLIRPRSSLMRNGVIVQSSVWDAGYSGKGYVMLMVENINGIKITTDARICQMFFITIDKETEGYNGIYQNE